MTPQGAGRLSTVWGESGPADLASGRDAPRQPRALTAVVRRRRVTIVSVFLGVVTIVAVVTALLPRRWQSTTTILIEERSRGAESSAFEVLERLGLGNQAETEIELIRSRRVIEPVVDELDLHVRVETAGGESLARDVLAEFDASVDTPAGSYRLFRLPSGGYGVESVDGRPVVDRVDAGGPMSFGGLSFKAPEETGPDEVTIRVRPFNAEVSAVRANVGAEQVRREGALVRVTCTGAAAAEAQSLCEAIGRSYMRLRTELQRDEASATATFLGEQVAQVESRLSVAEDSLEEFGRTHQVVALDELAAEEVRRLAGLQAEHEGLQAERASLRQLIEQVEAAGDRDGAARDLASFPTFLKNPIVSQVIGSLLTAEGERARLSSLRTERNSDLRAADQRVKDLEAQLRDIARSYEQAVTNQIGALETTLSRAGRRLAAIPSQQVEWARLQRQADLFDELYKFLETRRREAEVAEAVDLPSVRIVDRASLPGAPDSPNPPQNLGLAIVLGLVGGLGVGMVRDLSDRRVLDRGDLELTAGMPIIGLIPSVRDPGPLLPAIIDGAPAIRSDAPVLVPSWDQQLALEAFRSVVADLRFMGRETGRRVRSVAVTSAGPGEGKTFVSCNLALARALHVGRTMLVDADMRASRVSDFFGCQTAPGLSEVLAGLTDARTATTTFNVEDSGRLWVMPAGTPTLHSAALLEERLFDRLISLVEDNVDLLIVDTPPLNVLADAATIASSVDVVLVVVRRGVTDREGLQLTLERLARTGVPSIRVVFNDVTLPKQYATYTYRYAPTFGEPSETFDV